jgi:hypothetical protein
VTDRQLFRYEEDGYYDHGTHGKPRKEITTIRKFFCSFVWGIDANADIARESTEKHGKK